MIFSAPFFILLFLPIFLIIYYTTPLRHRTIVILLGSWLFYGFWRIDFLGLMICISLSNYIVGRLIDRSHISKNRRRILLIVGIVINLAVLGYFKYFNFGVESLNRLLNALGGAPLSAMRIILPIGISFYIFQATSYIIDVYRGDSQAATNFVELAAFIALFPQLIAGPILRYKDISAQFALREHSLSMFTHGFLLFMKGFCKKVLIADTVAPIADVVFALHSPTAGEVWLGVCAYAMQIYFDFCGYSNMAIGLGKMVGFNFNRNFNAPYRSRTIIEFWQRWHISLSTWLKDYLYIPLGGNRKGKNRTYFNLMIVMVLGGLWHGAAWNFLIWGIWHGGWLIVERALPRAESSTALRDALTWLRTIIIVYIGWIFFRAPTFNHIGSMLGGLIGIRGIHISADIAWNISGLSIVLLILAFIISLCEGSNYRIIRALRAKYTFFGQYALFAPLFMLGILKIIADSYSPFLYFRF